MSTDDSLEGAVRAVLFQSFLNRRCMSTSEALGILSSVRQAYKADDLVTREDLESTILQLNKRLLDPMEMQIVRAMDIEPTYVLKNNVSDEHSKFGSAFSAGEVGFINALIDLFFEESGASASYATLRPEDALRRLDLQSRLTGAQTRDVIRALVDDGWLDFDSSDSLYRPSVRLTIELEEFLREKYGPERTNSLCDCGVCKKIVVRGVKCPSVADRQCGGLIFHKACFDRTRPEHCPRCTTPL